MPEDFQNKFGFLDKSRKMINRLQEISSNSAVTTGASREIWRERNKAAKKALDQFVPEFAVMLDKKGYMERKGALVEHGGE
jgi:hypothetical protein